MRRNSKSYLFLIVLIAGVCFSFVYTRMQCVELDYKISNLNNKINRLNLENKELKADRARFLSPKKLKSYAKKNKLSEPSRKQIIILK